VWFASVLQVLASHACQHSWQTRELPRTILTAAALTCAHKAVDGHIPCLAQAIRPVLCWRHSTNTDKVERNGWRFVDGSYNVEIRPSVGLVVGGVWTLSKLTGWQHSQLIPHLRVNVLFVLQQMISNSEPHLANHVQDSMRGQTQPAQITTPGNSSRH
jgi:hypothetical protein